MDPNLNGLMGPSSQRGNGNGCSIGHGPLACLDSSNLAKLPSVTSPYTPFRRGLNPRRVRSGSQASACSSQLGHSQPQRPTVGSKDLFELVSSLGSVGPDCLLVDLEPCTAAFCSAAQNNFNNGCMSRSEN